MRQDGDKLGVSTRDHRKDREHSAAWAKNADAGMIMDAQIAEPEGDRGSTLDHMAPTQRNATSVMAALAVGTGAMERMCGTLGKEHRALQ